MLTAPAPLPPAAKLSVPLLTLRVPVLLNAGAMVLARAPPDLVNVPELLNAHPAPPAVVVVKSPVTVKTPELLKMVPFTNCRLPVPSQVVVALSVKVVPFRILAPPLKLSALLTVVAPLSVPPLQAILVML